MGGKRQKDASLFTYDARVYSRVDSRLPYISSLVLYITSKRKGRRGENDDWSGKW